MSVCSCEASPRPVETGTVMSWPAAAAPFDVHVVIANKDEEAARGAETFEIECSACHGIDGEGVPELGGPRLNDAIWLYGGSHAEIVAQINNPQQGVMPAWGDRLGETTVKQLAVYVHQLGGGQ